MIRKSKLTSWLTYTALLLVPVISFAAVDVTYTYDKLGRLKTATYEDTTVVTYSYDANGNRTVLAVTVPNDPPVAVNDSVSVPLNGDRTKIVTSNDSDPDGDPLTVVSVTQPWNAVATVLGNGKINFVGTSTGTGTCVYTISDGKGGTDTAIVTVTVTGGGGGGGGFPW